MKVAPYQAEQFIQNIAKNPNIFGALIYGPESGLVSIRSQKISKNITPDLSDPFLVTNISAEKIEEDKGLIADEFFSIPMLGGRKIIIVSDGGNKITEGLKLIFDGSKNLEGGNFILISAADLDKNSSLRKFCESCPNIATIACYEDDNSTSLQIIRQKFKENDFNIEQGVVELIVNKYGKNRLVILNEIEKLMLFSGENKNITVEMAEQVVSDIAQISAGEFVNYFADFDLENSLYALDKLFSEKFNSITLIRFLSNYFSKLQIAKINIENGKNLEEEIKNQRLFFKQEAIFRKHLSKWNLKSINEFLIKLQDLEVKCKGSGAAPELMLKSFVNYGYLKYKNAVNKN